MGMLFILAAGALTNIIIGNVFQASDLGIYALTVTIYIAFSSAALLGIDAALVKHIAQFKNDKKALSEYLSSALLTAVFLGFISGGLFFFISSQIAKFFDMSGLIFSLRVITVSFPFLLINKVFLGYFNGLKEMKSYSFLESSRYSIIILVTIITGIFRRNFIETLWAYPLAEALVSLALFFLMHRKYSVKKMSIGGKGIELLGYGWPLLFANALKQLAVRLDLLMLGYFLTAIESGVYSIVAMMITGMGILWQPLQRVAAPMVTEFYYDNKINKLEVFINRLMRYSLILYSVIAIFIWGYISEIILLLYPGRADYLGAAIPLKILGLALVFHSVTGCVATAETHSTGHPKVALYRVLALLGINFALNYLLIPKYELIGAAIATGISYFSIFVFSMIMRVRLLKIRLEYTVIMACITILGIIILGMELAKNAMHPFLITISAMFLYTILICAFGFVERKDILFIRNFGRKD